MYPYSFIVKALQKTKELIENKDEKIVIDTLDAAANAKVCNNNNNNVYWNSLAVYTLN